MDFYLFRSLAAALVFLGPWPTTRIKFPSTVVDRGRRIKMGLGLVRGKSREIRQDVFENREGDWRMWEGKVLR